MGCCGKDEEEDSKQEGFVVKRKCRDVLCSLFFLAFWAGMFAILGIAVRDGNGKRLLYGSDSYGFTCGMKTDFNGSTFDLSDKKNLYYLDPMELLTVANIPYAKRVCTDGCPPPAHQCDGLNTTTLPCTDNKQFRCNYYRFTEDFIYNSLNEVDNQNVAWEDTMWWDNLGNLSPRSDPRAQEVVDKLAGQSDQIAWVQELLNEFGISANQAQFGGSFYQAQSHIPSQGPCYPVWLGTKDIFNRCFPRIPTSWAKEIVESAASASEGTPAGDRIESFKDAFNSLAEKWTRYVADLNKGLYIIIVGGLVGGLVLSLFWMVVLRYLAGVMVWLTIFAVNLFLVGVTLYSFSLAGLLGNNGFADAVSDNLPEIGDPTQLERDTWKAIAIASAVVTGIVILITLLMISRLRIAIACIKVTSQAVGAMPSILFFPLLPFIFEVGLLIYWVAVTALLYSSGTLKPECRNPFSETPFTFSGMMNITSATQPGSPPAQAETDCYADLDIDQQRVLCGDDPNCKITYEWDDQLKYSFIYHFFGLLWTNQFIVGFSSVTIAGAIGSFYWAGGDSAHMPTFPVLTALKNTAIYHGGSIAFGAFIMAVIQFVRAVLEYIDRKTRELQAGNKIAQWLMCCVKCCMWCLEKIVAFINRNAYIMVAIKGTGYCSSACRAIALIILNALRLATVTIIGDLLLFLAKITVAAGCGLIAFGMSETKFYSSPEEYPETQLSSPILPVAVCILTGFIIAEIFFSVYEMGISTILLCFCEDSESHGTARYAPPLLMEAIGEEPRAKANADKPIKA
mmetsp:Transcript_11641/g.31727  ORF Transcript_11641/g.31727 Transcript_11641/m.31727 type:complete len:793 (-) Transcript_11641:1356-3734(-)